MDNRKDYFAFISYKHEDEKWAKWLQYKLEHYHFPTNLNGRTDLPKNIRPTFRDVTDMKPGILAEEINDALKKSQWLIVICSPRSAKSPWVCKEAQTFIDLNRSNYIIPFVIEGKPFSGDPATECFPKALLNLTGSKELLAANTNEMGRNAAVIKIIAAMFHLKFDSLWQRHRRKKTRDNILFSFIAAILLFLSCFLYSYILEQNDNTKKAITEKEFQQFNAEFLRCEKLYNSKNYYEAFNASKIILKSNRNVPDTLASKFEFLLRMSHSAIQSDTLTLTSRFFAEFPVMDWGEMPVCFNQAGDICYVGCNGFTAFYTKNGKMIYHSEDWPSDIRLTSDKIILFEDFDVTFLNKENFKIVKQYKLSTSANDYQMYVGSSADGARFLTEDSNTHAYHVYDTYSGNLINSFKTPASMASISGDGKILAMSEKERLALYKIDTGEKIHENENLYAASLQFDESGKWLLLYLEKYDALNILNLTTHESYSIDELQGQWEQSMNYTGQNYANKYFVSDDDRYIAIGGSIYNIVDGTMFKKLIDSDKVMGIKILPDAKKVIQINDNREILVYTRKGCPMFKPLNIKFSKILDKDKTESKYSILIKDNGQIEILSKNGRKIGSLSGINGDIYHLSISQDEKYILVSSLAIPSSIFDLTTGQKVQEFPFQPGDGDLGFGVIGNDGHLYFNDINTVLKYKFAPLKDLLNLDVSQ